MSRHQMSYHQPVLLKESIDGLNIKSGGIYFDLTFGSGGHSREILKRLGEGQLIAFDQDQDAMKNLIDDQRLKLLNNNFRYLKNWLRYYGLMKVDGILGDLGISSHQIDTPGRGFTFRESVRIDLRMNNSKGLTGEMILNEYPEEQLASIFHDYGELKRAGLIAGLIVRQRTSSPITKSSELIKVLAPLMIKGKEHSFLARIYQALRIEVNQELDALKEVLEQVKEVLASGGRLVMISYHSLEDRMIKNFIRSGNTEGTIEKDFYGNIIQEFKVLTKKPLMPSAQEILENPRARSARLRVAEKN